MRFELSNALMDDILFSMENQDGEFLLDTVEGIVVNTEFDEFSDVDETYDDEERYISLPEWSPSEGFRLMEHFAAGLRNPVVKEELSSALNSGKGVFRAFKNVLGQYPETEKLWFAFKEREMKKEVTDWYNALRESWGLELIGGEPDEPDDLVLEDFVIRNGTRADHEAAIKLHGLCLEAAAQEAESSGASAALLESMNPWAFPGDLCFAAETASGEFAGFISAQRGKDSSLYVRALEVAPRYRGLGLGLTLLRRLCNEASLRKDAGILAEADSGSYSRIVFDLPAESENFSRALLREAFKPQVQRYCRENG